MRVLFLDLDSWVLDTLADCAIAYAVPFTKSPKLQQCCQIRLQLLQCLQLPRIMQLRKGVAHRLVQLQHRI